MLGYTNMDYSTPGTYPGTGSFSPPDGSGYTPSVTEVFEPVVITGKAPFPWWMVIVAAGIAVIASKA